MPDYEKLADHLLLHQLRQPRSKLSDAVRRLPVRAAVTAEIGGQPAHASPEALRAVGATHPSGEQSVAVRYVHDVPGSAPGRIDRTRHKACPRPPVVGCAATGAVAEADLDRTRDPAHVTAGP